MKYRPKLTLLISFVFIALAVICFFSPTILREISKVETMVVYKDYKPQLADVSSMVCDTADNLYIASDSSDCIIVVSPEGRVLYTLFTPLSQAGGFEMIALQDGSVVVDAMEVPRYKIWSDGSMAIEPEPEKRQETMSMEYDQKLIYKVGSKSAVNSQGDKFTYNGFALQVVSKSTSGEKDVVLSNSIIGWVLGLPFPAILWAVIGGSLFSYNKWRKTYEDRS